MNLKSSADTINISEPKAVPQPDPRRPEHLLRPDVRLCRDGKIRAKGNSVPKLRTPEEIVTAFWQRVKKLSDDKCWEWQGGKMTRGYGSFTFNRTRMSAHRFSFTLHCGPIPQSKMICHHCDNPTCVNPNHLFLGDARLNNTDAVNKGRHRYGYIKNGENNPAAKLTATDVLQIRSQPQADDATLARQFGVEKTSIYRIRKRILWKHLP